MFFVLLLIYTDSEDGMVLIDKAGAGAGGGAGE